MIDDKLKEKIISAAYGSAGLADKIAVWFEKRNNPEAAKMYSEYKLTARQVNVLKYDECPVNLQLEAEKKINLEEKNKQRFMFNIMSVQYIGQFAAIAAILLVAAMTFFLHKPEVKQTPETITAEQVREAERETKNALALVGKVLNKSKDILKDDVLIKKVSKPINISIKTVNYLFNKGDKDETIN